MKNIWLGFLIFISCELYPQGCSTTPLSTTVNQIGGAVSLCVTPSSNTTMPTQNWQYIVITKDNNNNGNLYKNGQLVYSGSYSTLAYSWTKIILGCDLYISYVNWFKGWIDEVRMSNTVLTASDILNNYNANQAFTSNANTIGLWHFDQSSGLIANATVGTNGTLSNASWDPNGKFGSCLYYNGTNAKVEMLQSVPTSNMSFEFWIKPETLQQSWPICWYGTNTAGFGLNTDTVTTYFVSNLIAQDTIKACGDSVLVSATAGMTSYSWRTGSTTSSTYAKNTGWYSVKTINSNGCNGYDSVFVSIVKANILNNDTSICAGQSVKLSADSILAGGQFSQCAPIPSNLQNGLVGYWPFCGNANDASGNGNNGTVNGATLTTDRFGNLNSAYSFNGINNYISVSNANLINNVNGKSKVTIVGWINVSDLSNAGTIFSHWKHTPVSGPVGIQFVYFPTSRLEVASIHSFASPTQSTSISANQWKMVTCIFDGTQSVASNRFQVYIDNNIIVPLDCTFPASWVDCLFSSSLGTQADETFIGAASNMASIAWNYFKGKLDDIGIWNRALSPQEIQQLYTPAYPQTYLWSTGDTTPSINVTPNVTTKYWVRVSNGSHLCTDTVTVTVSSPPVNLIIQDTIKACGDSVLVSATSGLASYSWSNAMTTASIYAKNTGWYRVTATNSVGCAGSDSVFVSIVKANILNNDTSICAGQSVKLSADSILAGGQFSQCAPIPSNLQNGLVGYWPFCGNANDASGNGNNGTVNGATLTSDRFGNLNSAYSFDGINDFIIISNSNSLNFSTGTISFWLSTNSTNIMQPIKKGNYSDASGEQFAFRVNGLDNHFAVKQQSNCQIGSGWLLANSNYTFNTNSWKLITGVIKSDSVKFYSNNTLLISVKLNQAGSDVCSGEINIGRNWSVDPQWFMGSIDDIGIWNRALSPQEIQQLYTPAYPQTYLWSTGDTTPSINVTPSVTTKYWVRVSNGSHFCTDTVTVTVNQKTFSTLNQSICQGQTFLGRTTSGTYTDTLIGGNNKGCDSIRTLILTVNPKTSSTITKSICQGQTFLGRSFSGTYVDTLFGANSKGCDSIRTLILTVNPRTFSNINQTICQGQTYLGHSTSGFYFDTLFGANSKGCDSIRRLNLTVRPRTYSTLNQSICQGQSFLGRSVSGSYIDTLFGANSKGCDSVRTLNLTVNPTTVSILNQSICQGQTYLGRSVSGTYRDTFFGANSKGCDSIRTLILIVYPKTISVFTKTICAGDSFFGRKTSGVYVDTLYGLNSFGCDSIRTLNLTVNVATPPSALDSQIFCLSAQLKDLQIVGSAIKWYQDSMKKNSLIDTVHLVDNGAYYATQVLNSCESSYKKIRTYINSGSIVSDKPSYCVGDTMTLAFQSFFDKLLWFNGMSTKTIKLKVLQSKSYTLDFTYRNKLCSTSINTTVYPIPSKPVATSPQTYNVGNTLNDLVVSGSSINWYTDTSKRYAIPFTTQLQNEKIYYVTQRVNNCESSPTGVKVQLNAQSLLDSIYINNSMSPNNDAIMDAFTVENIHLAKNNKVQIFNRWGEIVYESLNYHNDWYGEFLKPGYSDNTLPDGVYYYTFTFTLYDQPYERTGYIYLKK